VFLACGNLPENNSGTERSHGFAVKYARHSFLLQIPAGIATCIVFALTSTLQ